MGNAGKNWTPPAQGDFDPRLRILFDGESKENGAHGIVCFGLHLDEKLDVADTNGVSLAVPMPVAVKFWRPGKAEVGYFCLEQARGHLRSHPCLMRVIAVHGEGAGGCPPPCIVMPRMHLSVQDLLDMRDPLPIDVVVRIVRDTLDGLKVLHSQGLVHNDIKPDNLFIGFTDCARSYLRLPSKEHTRDYCDLVGKRDFQVVIGDLGVAQREGEPAHPFGDDSYKAPEQRPSDPRRPADCRADTKFDIHAALKVLQQLIR